jgi:hypothetical protein
MLDLKPSSKLSEEQTSEADPEEIFYSIIGITTVFLEQ